MSIKFVWSGRVSQSHRFIIGENEAAQDVFQSLQSATIIETLFQASIKQKPNVPGGEDNILVQSGSDATISSLTYASLASSNRNKPIRESFIWKLHTTIDITLS